MNDKQIVLGEGSYGCAIKPRYDCKGNVNTNKNVITKISILDFNSTLTNMKLVKLLYKNILVNIKDIFLLFFQHVL